MARYKGNNILEGLSGSLGKQIVFKQYATGAVVSKMPDMSKVKPSAKQLEAKSKFSEAVNYARKILANPELKAAYQKKLRKGQTVYNFAIAEYMQQYKKQ